MLASCQLPDHEQKLFDVCCFGQCIGGLWGVCTSAAAAAAAAAAATVALPNARTHPVEPDRINAPEPW
jgi:hypothetical protein